MYKQTRFDRKLGMTHQKSLDLMLCERDALEDERRAVQGGAQRRAPTFAAETARFLQSMCIASEKEEALCETKKM